MQKNSFCKYKKNFMLSKILSIHCKKNRCLPAKLEPYKYKHGFVTLLFVVLAVT